MLTGSLPVWQFDEILSRCQNERLGGYRIISSRWGGRNNAPPGTATLVLGPWGSGDYFNIAVPEMPERTIRNWRGRKVAHGWNPLFRQLAKRGFLRPDPYLQSLLHEDLFLSIEQLYREGCKRWAREEEDGHDYLQEMRYQGVE